MNFFFTQYGEKSLLDPVKVNREFVALVIVKLGFVTAPSANDLILDVIKTILWDYFCKGSVVDIFPCLCIWGGEVIDHNNE